MNTASKVKEIPVWKNKSLENLPDEVWNDIPEFNGYYQASNLGRIKNTVRRGKHFIISQYPNKQGYLRARITIPFTFSKIHRVHRLVAAAFLKYKLDSYPELIVDHKNNDQRLNNTPKNLQVLTMRQNNAKEQRGKSKQIGVSWSSNREMWRARIFIENKGIELGHYKTEKEAIDIYKACLEVIY